MKAFHPPVSACRYCQFYNPIGRRGGACQMLGVSVQGVWKGCHLGVPQFTAICQKSEIDREKSHLIDQESEKEFQTVSELERKNITIA